MIKQGVIHLREPGLGNCEGILSCLWVVTPPYLIENGNLPNKAQKRSIWMKLCLVVLICVYQHESVRERQTKISLGLFLRTNETKSISLKCDWDELVFFILSMFRSWRVVGDTVGRCVTGQRLPLNGTAHTEQPWLASGWRLIWEQTRTECMKLTFNWPLVKYCYISRTHVWPWCVYVERVWGQREDLEAAQLPRECLLGLTWSL